MSRFVRSNSNNFQISRPVGFKMMVLMHVLEIIAQPIPKIPVIMKRNQYSIALSVPKMYSNRNNYLTVGLQLHECSRQYDTCSPLASHQSAIESGNNHTSPLIGFTQDFLGRRCGFQFKGNEGILVCVSGGSDSIALLEILFQLSNSPSTKLQLEAIHFNHQLRPEAEEEQLFVKDYCTQRSIPLHERRWSEDILPVSCPNGKSAKSGPGSAIQARAREWRRQESLKLQTELLKKHGDITDMRIATAHHAGDQEETMILQLLRGVHLSRLKGMDPVLPLPFVKPLISHSKQDLVEFLESQGIQWMEDKSNQERKYKRNKVRLDLLPELRDLAGGTAAFSSRMSDLAEQSIMLRDHLEKEVLSWNQKHRLHCSDHELPLHQWWDLSEIVQHEVVHHYLVQGTNIFVSFKQLKRIVEKIQGKENIWTMYIGKDWVLKRKGDMLRLEKTREVCAPPKDLEMVSGDLKIKVMEGWSLSVDRLIGNIGIPELSEESSWAGVLYNVPVGATLTIRYRQDGDRFHPQWRSSPMKLKDFLRGQKIPLHERDHLPLICVGDQIAAVSNLEASAEYLEDNTGVLPVVYSIRKKN